MKVSQISEYITLLWIYDQVKLKVLFVDTRYSKIIGADIENNNSSLIYLCITTSA
jgi:hypothetical protein